MSGRYRHGRPDSFGAFMTFMVVVWLCWLGFLGWAGYELVTWVVNK